MSVSLRSQAGEGWKVRGIDYLGVYEPFGVRGIGKISQVAVSWFLMVCGVVNRTTAFLL
jgi:hypothetical protein